MVKFKNQKLKIKNQNQNIEDSKFPALFALFSLSALSALLALKKGLPYKQITPSL
jgi:hypothetical protein